MIKFYTYLLIFLSSIVIGQRVQIEGEAEYNFSDNETLIEAKALCYNMALRNAVESYQVFVSSMSDVQNMQLRNDIIQTLSTGYIENLTVVSEKIDKNNNTIYYKLKAYIYKFFRLVEFLDELHDKFHINFPTSAILFINRQPTFSIIY